MGCRHQVHRVRPQRREVVLGGVELCHAPQQGAHVARDHWKSGALEVPAGGNIAGFTRQLLERGPGGSSESPLTRRRGTGMPCWLSGVASCSTARKRTAAVLA